MVTSSLFCLIIFIFTVLGLFLGSCHFPKLPVQHDKQYAICTSFEWLLLFCWLCGRQCVNALCTPAHCLPRYTSVALFCHILCCHTYNCRADFRHRKVRGEHRPKFAYHDWDEARSDSAAAVPVVTQRQCHSAGVSPSVAVHSGTGGGQQDDGRYSGHYVCPTHTHSKKGRCSCSLSERNLTTCTKWSIKMILHIIPFQCTCPVNPFLGWPLKRILFLVTFPHASLKT